MEGEGLGDLITCSASGSRCSQIKCIGTWPHATYLASYPGLLTSVSVACSTLTLVLQATNTGVRRLAWVRGYYISTPQIGVCLLAPYTS